MSQIAFPVLTELASIELSIRCKKCDTNLLIKHKEDLDLNQFMDKQIDDTKELSWTLYCPKCKENYTLDHNLVMSKSGSIPEVITNDNQYGLVFKTSTVSLCTQNTVKYSHQDYSFYIVYEQIIFPPLGTKYKIFDSLNKTDQKNIWVKANFRNVENKASKKY